MFFGGVMGQPDIECSTLLNQEQRAFWGKNHPQSYARLNRIAALGPDELRVFPDTHDATHRWFTGAYAAADLERMAASVRARLGEDYAPDLIIVFYHLAPYVAKTFPAARVVHFYEGGFSRAPYMPTWRFDEAGCVLSADTRALNPLMQQPCPPQAAAVMQTFSSAIAKALNANNPFAADAAAWRTKFSALALLTLQLSGRPAFDCACPYQSQLHYLMRVMDEMPSAVGVVVTEHPNYPVITPEIHSELTARYPNFIYQPSFLEVENSSFFLTYLVDAVITVSSSTIWHAMLAGKHACVLGRSDSEPFADSRSIAGLARALQAPSPDAVRFHNLLYALLKRHWIPETSMKNPDFVRSFLHRLHAGGARQDVITDDDLLRLVTETAARFKMSRRTMAQMARQVQMPLIVAEYLSQNQGSAS
jgi:hypothetical protein